MNAKLNAECKAAVAAGDDAIESFIRNISFTGMSRGMGLALHQLEQEPVGSLEGVLSLLRDHRDQWRDAADAEKVEEQ